MGCGVVEKPVEGPGGQKFDTSVRSSGANLVPLNLVSNGIKSNDNLRRTWNVLKGGLHVTSFIYKYKTSTT